MHSPRLRSRHVFFCVALAGLLLVSAPKRTRAESLLDFKTLYYVEDGDGIKVFAPTAGIQTEVNNNLTIRLEGVYNSISGATPTGAPMSAAPRIITKPSVTKPSSVPRPPVVKPPDDGHDDDDDDKLGRRPRLRNSASSRSALFAPQAATTFNSKAGATPPPAPPPPPPTPTPTPKPGKGTGGSTPTPVPAPAAGTGKVPTAEFDDTRVAFNLDLSYRMEQHTPGVLFSYSSESDYISQGIALRDAIDFNQKCTTLLLGVGVTYDKLMPANGVPDDTKTSVDFMVGVTQLIDPLTQVTLNATLGRVSGFISDPYKVVELNGSLVSENRPDSKDKQILYVGLARFFEAANGSLDTSYRFYNDSFGIQAHTVSVAWYQKLGEQWIVRPMARYYTQSEADFYGVRFTGNPSDYSSDYRVSDMDAWGGGLKVIWMPTSRLSFDVSYERYEQVGNDGVTPDDVYPSANAFMVGARLWF